MTIRALLSTLLLLLIAPGVAPGASFFRFQHGGRGVGEAGAMTARADDASVVTHNPAAAARLEGVHILAGLDFDAASDDYQSATGSFSSKHFIQFPPALYATWRMKSLPLTVGIGVDSPWWSIEEWAPNLFPGRFRARRGEVTLFEAHPIVAWSVTERLGVGGGVRYLRGSLSHESIGFVDAMGSAGPATVEVRGLADGTVDGIGADLGIHYAADRWAWGLTYRSRVELDGSGDLTYRLHHDHDLADPVLRASLGALAGDASSDLALTLPSEIRTGVAVPIGSRFLVEGDLAYQRWSELDLSATLSPDLIGGGMRRDGWDDTVSVRVGLEATLGSWQLYGGVAHEPSPVPPSRADGGFPRGDALVYALGFGWSHDDLAFDIGYSIHDFQDVAVTRQELLAPDVAGTFGSVDQVFGLAVRWRL